ncbi:MAG TPA: sigma-70 family RNA polymerase sigma factor [Gemmataceae bacterium]|jgi:RNA polymerase sigma-70 factor (ECF subfamily)|nr:sigma-70 family RNA polymerase sigma factor [Gemmataceae bacterium]
MTRTPASLFDRLRSATDGQAWGRFVRLYTPFLFHWAHRRGLTPEDAADLVQEVFAHLLKALPAFQYDAGRSFRAWLAVVVGNKWRELNRRKRPLSVPADDLADVAGAADGFAEDEYRRYVSGRALALIRTEFAPATWKAFWGVVVEGRPAADVAGEFGLTANAVYLARGRVLRRLREELAGLVED